MSQLYMMLIGGASEGVVVPLPVESRSDPLEVGTETYHPHSGVVFGRCKGVDGFMFAQSEFSPGEIIELRLR
jgi:hypothetical protein